MGKLSRPGVLRELRVKPALLTKAHNGDSIRDRSSTPESRSTYRWAARRRKLARHRAADVSVLPGAFHQTVDATDTE